jgi:cephalosporin hydroxylase
MTNDDHRQFKQECSREIADQGADSNLKQMTLDWVLAAAKHKYSYHFEWLGRPIIQHPQDMVGLQQLLWAVQPDLVIETGIARGGSLIFSASILELIAQCGGNPGGRVLGIDIQIREHNRRAILEHPMSRRIEMIEGSSISAETHAAVVQRAKARSKIMVLLDSNHTHEHVLAELQFYAPLVGVGSYCVVFDTIIADMPADAFPDRPWTSERNPKSAVHAYLQQLGATGGKGADGGDLVFEIDKAAEHLLLITVAPDGFLRRV